MRIRLSIVAALVAALAMAACTPAPPAAAIPLQLLTFNDFHGNLEPPAGSSGRLSPPQVDSVTDVGGVEYFATEIKQLRQGHGNTITAAAGDLIGGSTFLSGLFHDEPTIASMEKLGLDVSSVGNHEFDEGLAELNRIQYGGCHPVDGCYFPDDPYDGASFPYLAANVTFPSGQTVLPPTWVKNVHGVKVGFIGMTLEGTPLIVSQKGIQGLQFHDEVETANAQAAALQARGVQAIVALIHEGGAQSGNFDRCDGVSGPIIDIAENLAPSIDMVVSGHTHQPYVCNIPDPAGQPRMLTSASSFGRVVTETNMLLDPSSGDVIRSSVVSHNHLVVRTLPKDPDQTALIAKWKTLSAPIGDRVVGTITADITRTGPADTPLGDLIANAQLAATDGPDEGRAVIALMNPGGVRADLVYAPSGSEPPGAVTYAEAFTTQPFGNLLVTMDLTGAQLKLVLDEMRQPGGAVNYLGVSSGLTFDFDNSQPSGNRVSNLSLNGAPVDPAATYRVATNNFLSDGGDQFGTFTLGTNKVVGTDDLTALVNYLGANSPVAPPASGQITVIG